MLPAVSGVLCLPGASYSEPICGEEDCCLSWSLPSCLGYSAPPGHTSLRFVTATLLPWCRDQPWAIQCSNPRTAAGELREKESLAGVVGSCVEAPGTIKDVGICDTWHWKISIFNCRISFYSLQSSQQERKEIEEAAVDSSPGEGSGHRFRFRKFCRIRSADPRDLRLLPALDSAFLPYYWSRS